MPDLQFFADEQISGAVISGLKRHGIRVLSTHEAGRSGMTDESHVAFCEEQGYVLVTEDEDFLALARAEPITMESSLLASRCALAALFVAYR